MQIDAATEPAPDSQVKYQIDVMEKELQILYERILEMKQKLHPILVADQRGKEPVDEPGALPTLVPLAALLRDRNLTVGQLAQELSAIIGNIEV